MPLPMLTRLGWDPGWAAAAVEPTAVPAAGDWVLLASWPDARVTTEVVLPRRTAIVRAKVASGSTHGQVLAAKADVVAVVEGMAPDPDPGRLERLLALAWSSGARPPVVLTKADLVADPAALVGEVADLAPGCDGGPAGRFQRRQVDPAQRPRVLGCDAHQRVAC